MRLQEFDTSDTDAELLLRARVTLLQRNVAVSRAIAARAFAQGFTAALEDGNASGWLPHYRGRKDG